jgi:hypothetical protein
MTEPKKTNIQEAFNIVTHHLLNQNRKSEDAAGGCLYRDEYGNKCAIGILIPDHLYTTNIESFPVINICDVLEDAGLEMSPVMKEMLIKLQNIHDNCEVENWKHNLKDLSKFYNLEWPQDIDKDSSS